MWDGMIKDANSTNHLANDLGLLKATNVRRIANNYWGFCLLAFARNSNNLARFEQDLIDVGIEHVGATVNGAKTTERFRKTTESIDWIKEGRVTVLTERIDVEVHLANGVDGGLIEVGVVSVESNCVA